jgi:hypothetical protein
LHQMFNSVLETVDLEMLCLAGILDTIDWNR